jgi:D-serine deaminase-like pyridoxal phosphate-dependent protein
VDALDLDTPAVYVDLDVLERNIARMQERCRGWNVALRPHTKTHKIPEIARLQLDAGAIGITVAKLGEAEVLPGDDVLVAYPLMPPKLPRLRALAAKRRVITVVDAEEGAHAVGDVPALVEVDVGVGRCGVRTPEDLVRTARACARFEGIFYWPSWIDEAGFHGAAELIANCMRALAKAGLRANIVSGGSTPGASHTPLIPETTEIRPGTYVFYDGSSLAQNLCGIDECALRVLTTVVSTAVPGQCVIDGGTKTFSNDPTVGPGTFGVFPDKPGWVMKKMNEEHGYVTIGAAKPTFAEKVWVVPSHVCSTVNMHDEIWYGRKGHVDGSWQVAARGRVR